MNYHLTSNSSRGNFTVTDQDQANLATVTYEDWFSSAASATFADKQIVVKSRNIWWSNFDVFVDDEDRGDLTFNWKGHIIIKLTTENGATQTFRLKLKGFWDSHFVLENEQENLIIELLPSFKWQKMNYNYEVRFTQDDFSAFDQVLLLIVSGYAANLYMTMMAAAV